MDDELPECDVAPNVSIILPTFDGEKYLSQQIESILAQTHQDFELLIMDDGSADASAAIASHYSDRDERIRVIPSQGRQGQVARLKTLINEAAGDLISIADQDDVWAPERTSRLLSGIGDASIAVGRSELINDVGSPRGTTLLQKLGRSLASDAPLSALFAPMFSGHAQIIRRDAINPAALSSPLTFDWMMALDAIFSGGMRYVDDAVVYHRIHATNQQNTVDEASTSRFSAGFVRNAFLYRRSARLNFWLVLDHLGRSPVLSEGRRTRFSSAASAAYMTWFSQWRPLRGDALNKHLKRCLLPLAGAPSDWKHFCDQADLLTAGTASAPVAKEAFRRLSGMPM